MADTLCRHPYDCDPHGGRLDRKERTRLAEHAAAAHKINDNDNNNNNNNNENHDDENNNKVYGAWRRNVRSICREWQRRCARAAATTRRMQSRARHVAAASGLAGESWVRYSSISQCGCKRKNPFDFMLLGLRTGVVHKSAVGVQDSQGCLAQGICTGV
jgi:hypothetical protein